MKWIGKQTIWDDVKILGNLIQSITIKNTATSHATSGGILKLMSDDGAKLEDDHRIGCILFQAAEDSSGTIQTGASIEAFADAAWDTTVNDTRLEFYTKDGDNNKELSLTLDSDLLATFTGQIMSKNTGTSSSSGGGVLRLASDDGAALGEDHRLGKIAFQAAEDGSGTIREGASIEAKADAAWSGSENGTRLEFYTMDGDNGEELSLTLDSDKLATFAGAVTVTGALTGTLATASQTNITGVGTITTGVWNGTRITSAYLDADTAYLTTDQTFTGRKTFDVDRSVAQGNAGAEDITALHVDFDRERPDSGTYAHNDRGIDLDVTSASLGTSSLYGMDIDVVGTSSGTSTAYGVHLDVDGADTNIGMVINTAGTHIKLEANADADDYATLAVADTGDLTIQTIGDGTTDSDLTLSADGIIDLQPADGKSVRITSNETSAANTGGILNLISNDGAALGDDHRLGKLGFLAAEDSSSTYREGAYIAAFADAAWSASENGTRLEFYTMDGDASSELSLTLDSDKLATFRGAVIATGFTGDVTGDLTGQADTVATIAGLAPNTATTQATQPNIESIGTDGDTLDILSDILSMTNTSATTPIVQLTNTTDDENGPHIKMINQRGGSAGADGDDCGTMQFMGYDDQGTPAVQIYATILGEIHDATSGQESGRLNLQVANHDGGLGSGLILTGGNADNEINATLGLGTDSIVTIPGDINMFNPVNDASPIIKIGSGNGECLSISPSYDSGAQTLDQVNFMTTVASGTADKGKMIFGVDSVSIVAIKDAGIEFAANMGIKINGVDIISDSSGTATLSNIDVLDATTKTTIATTADAATASATGVVELATTAEADTGTDTSRAITAAGLKSHVDARYARSVISFQGQATMLSSGNWVTTSQQGIANHTWNQDVGVNTETNGTSAGSLAKQYGHMGIRMSYACTIENIYCAVRNASGNRQVTVGLFCARAADGTTAVDWGTTDATEPILQIHADANNEGGTYQNRPTHAEVSTDVAMAAGDMFYPAIKLTGVTSGGNTDNVLVSFSVGIKTLIA